MLLVKRKKPSACQMQLDRPLAFDMESALNILKKKQQQKGAAGEKRVGCCFPQLQDEFSALVSRDVAG